MIEAKNLSKWFGRIRAVDGISFEVDRGEVLGFLGPNAAGKSTTMRMITGFLPPTSGNAVVGGDDIVQSSLSARKKIGYLPENAPVYLDMTVYGFLDFIAEIRGLAGQQKARRIEQTIERCFLREVRLQTINTLSKGFKQRVCFAQCILHDPDYLIMDEPTDGLDPNQKHEVRAMIREMGKNKTIILSTHNLEEVDAVCTRAIIISNGKIVADDTPQGLRARSSIHGAVCFTLDRPDKEGLLEEVKNITGVKGAEILGKDEGRIKLRVYPEGRKAPTETIVGHFRERGERLENLYVEEGRLDEVFRMITAPDSGGIEE